VDLPDDEVELSIRPIGNKTRVDSCKIGKLFKTDYARIGPFITSFGRFHMLRSLLAHIDSVVYIHTDGFVSTKQIPELKIGKEMGDQWKCQPYAKAEIASRGRKPIFN
jgi:hypothetical protein